MKRLALATSLLLTACSTSHHVKIKRQPCLYPLKGYDFTLCRNFKFQVDTNRYDIPRGFTTDLASVPRILWSIYSPSRTETIAGAIIHDYLYFCPNSMTRAEADSIFYDALVLQGITKSTAFRYWAAVRLFGDTNFKQGASCTHAYTGTTNTIGNMRLAVISAPAYI